MSMAIDNGPVLVIVGPTGVGKTSFAIELAKRIDGEIISADSRYLYLGMDIGTAKPTEDELSCVRHHLINVAKPHETWALPQILEKTLELINEIHARNKIPIITGGTGQYIRALTEGWRVPELVPDLELRSALAEWGGHIGARELHHKLAIIDPAAADFIDASNLRRTVRALEVIFSTGHRFSDLRQKDGPAHAYWMIGLFMERDKLYRRVDERIDRMIRLGLEKEVRDLLANGYGAELPSMSAIGYREMVHYINGEIDLETAKTSMRRNTRNLVRRQANWFKPTNPEIHWYEVMDDTLDQVLTDLTKAGILK